MNEKELSVKTVDDVLEAVRYDIAVELSDDTFYDMLEVARARQEKDKDIDLPMVALRTLTSSLYTLGKLGWTKDELYREVDAYYDMAKNAKKKKKQPKLN